MSEETLARNLPSEPAEVDWNIIHNISRGPVQAFGESFAAEDLRPTVVVSCFPLIEKLPPWPARTPAASTWWCPRTIVAGRVAG